MRIRTRKVATTRTVEDVKERMRSAAYYWPKGKFEEDSFAFYCARRRGERTMRLIPVRGLIFSEDGQVKVLLEIHADLTFYIGAVIALSGVLEAICMLILQLPKWYTCFMAIPFGAIVSCSSLLVASEILDRLEFKLCRKD